MYVFKPVQVGLCALSPAVGAILAIPFQKASWFSRARSHRPRSDSMTFQKTVVWSSHLVRRTLFSVALPISAVSFTVTSIGPPFSVAVPCVMAGFVGFFSNLAIAECCGLLFEAFDTSDLQPGMTGRPARKSIVQRYADQRTNFSCYPRIMAGVSTIQALKYGLAAAATGLTGRVTRSIGAMQATAAMAGILLGLTILLTIILVRWHTVQMIPESRTRRDGSIWEPVILGRPSGTTRKISILEAGKLTRWSEIRRRNRLESSLTGG